jgi:hypothetical protein
VKGFYARGEGRRIFEQLVKFSGMLLVEGVMDSEMREYSGSLGLDYL